MSMNQWYDGRPVGPGAQYGQYGVAHLRASDSDRERAVDVLRAAYGEGRLTKPEHDQRVAEAYQAATYGELARIVGDLPQGPLLLPPALPGVPQTFLPPPAPTNAMAVGALVCGVLEFLTLGATALPAVVMGHAARAQIRRSRERGDALAVTGLVLGWMGVVCWVLLLITFVAAVASGGPSPAP